MKNQTRSDLFIGRVDVGFLAVERRAKRRLLQEKQNRGDRTQVTRRLIGRLRKAKSCTEINSGVTSDLY
ncbi:hypothetical protein COJ01_21855 [Priestia megaterium]|nr:hypothetical protein AWX17_15430 [Priestia megaterium]PFK96912.1 hypothetical protein COJ01_21855 [Priestia megaterium]